MDSAFLQGKWVSVFAPSCRACVLVGSEIDIILIKSSSLAVKVCKTGEGADGGWNRAGREGLFFFLVCFVIKEVGG